MENKCIYIWVFQEKKLNIMPLIQKKIEIYINTGSMLVNLKKIKSEKIYEKCVKNKHS